MCSAKQPQPLELETIASVCEADRVVASIEAEVLRTPSFLTELPVAGRAARTSLAGRCFLVVEDEVLIGLDMVAGLECAGARIEGPVGTTEQAIEIIERTSLDGVFLHLTLHGRPVTEILSVLTRRNIPFVFVTAHGRDRLPPAFREVAMLTKPFSHQQMVDAAADLLA